MPAGKARVLLTLIALAFLPLTTAAGDWPMWRHDAGRSAASPHSLPPRLQLQWVRSLPPLKPAWPDQPKLQVDTVYEPVVLGKRLFVGSSCFDSVTAYDIESGKELWRFHTDGPVRYPPAAWENKVYFTSDDGYIYCVEATRGALLWRFRGGPSERKVLGNGRLISAWPARGGPAIADGTVYFAAGIWPFMGIFLHALDARTGRVVWTNDGDGSLYIKQPHNADAFAGVAPQGALVVSGDKLLVPGGRSVPACYDRHTGKLLYFRLGENGKRGGGSLVAANERFFFNGDVCFELEDGKFLGAMPGRFALTDWMLSTADSKALRAFDLTTATLQTIETVDRKGKKSKESKWTVEQTGVVKADELTALIQAGDRLYVGAEDEVFAVELPLKGQGNPVSWRANVDGTVASLVAADDRLFAVTRQGQLYCFGEKPVEPRIHGLSAAVLPPLHDTWGERVRGLVERTGVHEGYCIVWGVGSGRLIAELVRQTALNLIVIDPDGRQVQEQREHLQAAGVPCERVTVLHGDPLTIALPPYLASLMVTESCPSRSAPLRGVFIHKAVDSLRPFGGVACFPSGEVRQQTLARLASQEPLSGATVSASVEWVFLERKGPLPGSANWTHEHGDAANTRVSHDRLVKAPLGILWFGGPSHDGILPRHGHGPQPQVVDGRLFLEGVDMLRCMDCYTGRILWEAKLPGVGAFYNNLAHQPGANSSGTNYVALPDGIYVAYGKCCVRLDPVTGRKLAEFRMPPSHSPTLRGGEGSPIRLGESGYDRPEACPTWGYLNVAGDVLVGGADPMFDANVARESKPKGDKNGTDSDDPLSKLASKVVKATNDNYSSSKRLVVMDRHTGRVRWSATAESGFRHNAICIGGDRLYCIDRLSGPQLARLKRRGEEPNNKARLLVLDLKTGRALWQTDVDVFGTWLSYSTDRDILIEAGRVARDTISDEPKGMRAYEARTGRILWFERKHSGPAMIHGDTILMAGNACDLRTGKLTMRKDPLTDEEVEWTWTRGYGCNTPLASEYLLTFRSGAAGYYDLCNDGGTGNLGGFRSSCTNNLIVAAGLLNAPDYTRTCVCNYQNQASLALIHMPEVEMWTYFGSRGGKGPVRRVGINFGAPGDRRAEDGTLWIEYPSTGGLSPVVPITTQPARPEYIRHHSSLIEGEGPKWVAASAVKGLNLLTLDLGGRARTERRFTVRLYFAELEAERLGERVFDVALQGETVLKGFDILREAGGRNRSLVKEFKGIPVTKELVVTFLARDWVKYPASLLNGIEVVEEGK
jgi:outer membrane protein assembly factor BamB